MRVLIKFLCENIDTIKEMENDTKNSHLMFDIRKNSELIQRYLGELQESFRDFVYFVDSLYTSLQRKITDIEKKLIKHVEELKLTSLLDQLTEVGNLQEYQKVLENICYGVTAENQDGVEVEVGIELQNCAITKNGGRGEGMKGEEMRKKGEEVEGKKDELILIDVFEAKQKELSHLEEEVKRYKVKVVKELKEIGEELEKAFGGRGEGEDTPRFGGKERDRAETKGSIKKKIRKMRS